MINGPSVDFRKFNTHNILAPKQADAKFLQDNRILQYQLKALPEMLREDARMDMLLNEDIKRKELQDWQFVMINRIEILLRANIEAEGLDPRKFQIGGHERGTYEKFFRIEPALYMTKPQFLTAIRRCFGDSLIKNESAINKLYDSFDQRRLNEMDWRSFLYILTIAMQPILSCSEHLRYAFAIYSSLGSLDLDCGEKMTLKMIKDMICAPVLLALRAEVRNSIEAGWQELVEKDWEALTTYNNAKIDPDSAKISYKLFNKLLHETSFSIHMGTGLPYGFKDTRPWTYEMEEVYFHPMLVDGVKILRRFVRNENECDAFISKKEIREKWKIYVHWKEYVAKRNLVRRVFVTCSIRWRNDQCATFFDIWRDVTIVICSVNQVQRAIRGFTARRRRNFIKSIQKSVLVIQRKARMLPYAVRYHHIFTRQRWAVVTIQRNYRGMVARVRVQSIIMARYDVAIRKIETERILWMEKRYQRAAFYLQMWVRRFIRKCRIKKRSILTREIKHIGKEMERKIEEARVQKNLYRQDLLVWFVERKKIYDLTTMNDQSTAEERIKILAFRNRAAELAKAEREADKILKLEKDEEVRIEMWLKAWDVKKEKGLKDKRLQVKRALIHPESLEEALYKKELMKRIKAQVKIVLRRADKQKIPMEIPEANELATIEVIDAEIEAQKELYRIEQYNEASALQVNIERKIQEEKETVLRGKRRRRKFAAFIMQGAWKIYQARKVLRSKAYKRYKKMFDGESLQYYYLEQRTKKMQWNKPYSLGNFDAECDEGWVICYDGNKDRYYYNPRYWTMQYELPMLSYLCDICAEQFATAKLGLDKKVYCDFCLHNKCEALSLTMPAREIKFKPFRGCKEGSYNTRFMGIKDENWLMHKLKLDPTLKDTMEEVGYTNGVKDKWKGPICSRCKENESTRNCDFCVENFCTACYDGKHKKAPWDQHTYTILEEPPEAKKIVPITMPNRNLQRDKSILVPPVLNKGPDAVGEVGKGEEDTGEVIKKKKKKKKSVEE